MRQCTLCAASCGSFFDGRDWSNAAEYLEFLLRWVEQDVMIWVSEDALGADPKCAKSAGTVNGTYRISVATGASQEPERE